MQELLEKIVIAPTGELLSQLGFELYNIGQQLVNVKNDISTNKEKFKDTEANKMLLMKADKENKKTLPEIEAIIRLDTEQLRYDILNLEHSKESLFAKYEGAKLVFEASKTRLIIERKEF